MNLRTLKKLSKRAAPILPTIGDERTQFSAERDYNYTSTLIGDRKHWARSAVHQSYSPRNDWSSPRGRERIFTSRAGRKMVLRPPTYPRKGTAMVGGTDGGETPEWSETTAWEALREHVFWHFVDYDEAADELKPTRVIRTVRDTFEAAAEIARQRRDEQVARAALRASQS